MLFQNSISKFNFKIQFQNSILKKNQILFRNLISMSKFEFNFKIKSQN